MNTNTSEARLISVSLLDPNPANPRKHFDEAQLAELTVSVASMGVTNPITVRPGWSSVGKGEPQRYEIVSGHRRAEAAKRAGLPEIPAIVRELSDAEVMDWAIVDNLQRVDLSPMEEAEGYRLLMKSMGYNGGSGTLDTDEDLAGRIALKVGKTLRYIVQRIKLLSLIPEAQDVMRQGYLGLEVALQIARLQPDDQERAIVFAIDHRKAASGKTVAEKLTRAIANIGGQQGSWYRVSTEKEVREWIANNIVLSLKAAPWALDDVELVPVTGACTTCPKRVGSNTALFGDLTSKEDTCTDPACYESKQKAFVKLTIKESAESGSVVLKLSTSRSTLPIKEGSTLEKTTFKDGQWVEAKKGSCPDTHRGVTEEGKFKTVCVNQKCKTHKHEVQQPAARGERVSTQEYERREKEAKERRECLEKEERPIRGKIWAAILAKLDTNTAIKAVADAQNDAARIRKKLLTVFPKLSGPQLEAFTIFCAEFGQGFNVNGYWISQDGGIADERKDAWNLAKTFGVNADAIAAKHFHDSYTDDHSLKNLAPHAVALYPKGVPWPKGISTEIDSAPAKKGAHSKPVKLSAEARKRIAAAQKARIAKAKKAAAKPAKKAAKKAGGK